MPRVDDEAGDDDDDDDDYGRNQNLPETMYKEQSIKQISQKGNKSCPPFQQRQKWQHVDSGRIVFVVFLTIIAGMLGYFAYFFLKGGEDSLTETQFRTVADRALDEAARIAQRKRFAITTMAGIVGRMLPNASEWPVRYFFFHFHSACQ